MGISIVMLPVSVCWCVDAAMTSPSQLRRRQKYSDGSVYDGEWNSDGERHGVGSLTYSNNTSYTGQFEHGLHSGIGAMTIPDRYE